MKDLFPAVFPVLTFEPGVSFFELVAFVAVVTGFTVQIDVQLCDAVELVCGSPPEPLSDVSVSLLCLSSELLASLFDCFLLRFQDFSQRLLQVYLLFCLGKQAVIAGDDHGFQVIQA